MRNELRHQEGRPPGGPSNLTPRGFEQTGGHQQAKPNRSPPHGLQFLKQVQMGVRVPRNVFFTSAMRTLSRRTPSNQNCASTMRIKRSAPSPVKSIRFRFDVGSAGTQRLPSPCRAKMVRPGQGTSTVRSRMALRRGPRSPSRPVNPWTIQPVASSVSGSIAKFLKV